MRKKNLLAALSCATLIAAVAGATSISGGVYARAIPVWSEVDVESSYDYGAEFELPQRKLTVGGKYGKVSVVLRYPSGTETAADTAVLSEAGIYTLRYIAEASGGVYLDEKTFTVTSKYAYAGGDSTVEYGQSEQSIKYGANALKVRLAAGETLKFAKPVDLSECTRSNTLIDLLVTPDNIGNPDFEKITVRLTDVYDPNVYFETSATALDGNVNHYRAWTLSRGNGQIPKGYDYGRDGVTLKQNVAGTSTSLHFDGILNDGQNYGTLKISYDYDTNCVYVADRLNVDLDSPDCFPESLWSGFTDGKAFVSIICDMYSSATANFEVYSVYGLNLADELYYDTDAPIITVDVDENNLAYAEVGRTYIIPSATAFDDVCGYTDVSYGVYYNYNSPNPVSVACDGKKFTTNYAGYYAIVYTAKDYSGNVAEKVLWVNCYNDAPNPIISINESEKRTEVKVGEKVKVAFATVDGGSGVSDIKVFVEYENVRTEATDGLFIPKKSGEYTVVYVATDEIGQTGESEYNINVTVSSDPVYAEEAVMPGALIKGGKYKVPTLIATDYSGKTVKEIIADCEISDGSGTKRYKGGEEYIPAINEKRAVVTFKFIAGNSSKTYEVPCVDVWNFVTSERKRLDYAAYFLTADTITSQKTRDGISLTASSDGTAEFINPLLAEKFSLIMKGSSTGGEFGKVTITLTDDSFTNVSVTATFEERNGKTYVTVGDKTVVSAFVFNGSSELSFSYFDKAFTISGLNFPISMTDDGKSFEGFASHKVRLKIAFENVADESSVLIESLLNHSFVGSSTTDNIEPAYYVPQSSGGVIESYETVIPAAYAADVIDPNVIFTLSVVDDAGNYLTDVNGQKLQDVDPTRDYVVRFPKVGGYAARYYVSDTFNSTLNYAPYSVSYTIEDDKAPTITFKDKIKTEIKAGEIYIVPRYSVKDNLSGRDKIEVYMSFSDPSGDMKEIPSYSNSFEVKTAGVYRVYFMVVDEAGNIGFETIEITVTEG